MNCIYNTMFLAALVALLQLHSAAENNRWSLVRAHPKAVIDVAESKHDGIGGFETGSFVKVVIMQWWHPSCYGTQYIYVGTAAVYPMLLVLPPRGTAGLCPPPPSACMSMFPLHGVSMGCEVVFLSTPLLLLLTTRHGFSQVAGQYHAFINELPTIQPYSHCPKLWWDAVCQLG